ncbi:MAG: RNA polymerase sigma factor [Verrucomicrobiota bacterium]
MQPPDLSDPALLAAWLDQRREEAFRELVARYAGLVHAAARRTCGDEALAAEAAQLTFIALARKAKSLAFCNSLAGWLHRAAILHGRNLLRQTRRENRKRQALHAAMEAPSHSSTEAWQDLLPQLDAALAALSAKDREALLLRFYRALSVREIAATLGIATAAAQKRVDRATDRLRGKLLRRGCQAGGSLSAVLVAGFASDVQAAAPAVTMLASQALAAGAVSSGMLATAAAYLTVTAMKTTSVVMPLVILLAAGVWLAGQFRSIARLEDQNASLQRLLGDRGGAVDSMKSHVSTKTALDGKPVNWAEVASQLRNGNRVGSSSGGFEFLNTNQRLLNRFLGLTRNELIADLDDLETAAVPRADRDLICGFLQKPLIEIDPGWLAQRLGSRLKRGEQETSDLPGVLAKWTLREPQQAVAWLDGQIAAKTIAADSKPIELAVISALLPYDADAAARRLAALPADKRNVIWAYAFGQEWGDQEWAVWKQQDLAAAFARLTRLMPEKDHLNSLAGILVELGEVDRNRVVSSVQGGLAGMDHWRHDGDLPTAAVRDFFDRIGATPAERKACIDAAIRAHHLTLETLRAEYPEALR